ncbi:glycosyltransferase family 4 protein [Algoriphagus namhaensis]|uniref:Glycosyltransferase family 4 protein n=1 Tax=Algoriphagus namhaensis TaxID=915353 RepID=A0ABV8AVV5_9BACT
MSKRVLIALHRYEIGGAETQAFYLGCHLKQQGFDVIFSAFGSELGQGFDRFEQEGFSCIRWGFQEKLILDPPRGLLGGLRRYRFLLKLFQKVRALKVDAIIPFTYPPNLIFCSYFSLMGAKTCLWNQRDEGRFFLGNIGEIRALKLASAIVSNSREGMGFLQNHTSRKITLIKNAVDLKKFSRVAPDYKSNRVVMIGNIHGFKDHLTLLEAWKIVLVNFPNLKLALAGRNGSAYPELLDFVRSQGIEESVDFIGGVNDIPKMLKSCILAVFSSENEGVPNGVLEPMASTFSVVATDIMGCREALGDDYPFLVQPKDPIDFADKICQLIRSEELMRSLGKANQERIIKNFSIEKMGESYIKLLDV